MRYTAYKGGVVMDGNRVVVVATAQADAITLAAELNRLDRAVNVAVGAADGLLKWVDAIDKRDESAMKAARKKLDPAIVAYCDSPEIARARTELARLATDADPVCRERGIK